MSNVEEKIDLDAERAKLPVDTNKIRAMLDDYNSARIRTWLNICSGCGLCAESCFYYLSSDKDATLSPAYKLKSTLGEMYKRKGNVDRAFLESCYETLWLKCTTCKRCSQFCPFGIDIATMMSLARSICYSQGIPDSGLVVLSENHRKTGNHSALSKEEFMDTCEWMADEASDDISGVNIPIDKQNARYMYAVNPREIDF